MSWTDGLNSFLFVTGMYFSDNKIISIENKKIPKQIFVHCIFVFHDQSALISLCSSPFNVGFRLVSQDQRFSTTCIFMFTLYPFIAVISGV